MDPMLFKAAKDGDVQALLKSLHGDPLILERATTTTADTPLHVAAMFGHLEFVKELVKNMSNNVVDHVKELNQHGFSALHLASSKGHVEVVKELFKVVSVVDHQDLCSLKGRDGLTPLHCASIQGRVEIIDKLFSTSPGCVSVVNEAGETALHLAVKNYQLGALATLVDVIKQNNMLEILNSKDMGGNTVLHVAAARKNYQAIELLLKCSSNETPGIAINATNEKGLTALDLLLLCPCETGLVSEAAERLLRHAGEEIARVPTPPAQANSGENEILVLPTNNQSTEEIPDIDEPWEDYFKFQYGKDKPKDVRNSQLVVAVLMATATYTAGLTPPGGLYQDGDKKGQAILASTSPYSFIFFTVFNSVGFYISLNTIMILTYNLPLFWELYVAMIAMIVTYNNALSNAVPTGYLQNTIILVTIFLPALIYFVSKQIRYIYRRRRSGSASRYQHV